MEEKSNILFGGPDEMVETLLFFSGNTQFLLWKAFLEQLNASVAVPEGEESLLTLTKAVLFFYDLDVLQMCAGFFLFIFDSKYWVINECSTLFGQSK